MAPKYRLLYFNTQGRAEAIRFLFAYGNLPYEDVRYTREEFNEKIKPTLPFGQVPILEVDGVQINQSAAIGRYVATLVNLRGKNELQAALADAIVDNIWDLGNHFRAAFMGKPEELNESLPKLLKQFEIIAKNNGGYLAGENLTWADFVFASLKGVINKFYQGDFDQDFPTLSELESKVTSLPAIKKWIEERPVEPPRP